MSKHDRDESKYKKLRDELKKSKKDDEILRKNIMEEFRADRMLVQTKRFVFSPPNNQTATSSSSSTSTSSSANSTTIQIRMADGSKVRIILQKGDTLSKLWDEVEARTDIRREAFTLIQPLPRQVFEEDTFDSSLSSFGLVPNATLVVERKKVPQTVQEEYMQPVQEDYYQPVQGSPIQPMEDFMVDPEQDEEDGEEVEDGGYDYDEDNDGGHDDDEDNAGGHDDDEDNDGGHDNDEDNDGGHDDDEDNDGGDDDDNDHHDDIGQWGPDNMHTWGPGYHMVQRNYGLPDLSHQNRNAKEMMAEAAARRMVRFQQQQQQQAQQQQEQSQTPTSRFSNDPIRSLHFKSPHSLKDISMFALLNTVLASRPPYNIGDLPTSLAEEGIAILVKQGELKPHHLRNFVRCRLQGITLDNFKNCSNEILLSLKKHAHLRHVSLRNLHLITNKGIDHLSCLRNLRSLNLSDCSSITDGAMPSIAELKSLEVLSLDRTCITDRGVTILCESRPPTLSYLNLASTNITDAAINHLHLISKLRVLILEECRLSSIEGLEKVTTLTDLNLSSTYVTTEGVSRLQTLIQLKSLKLSNTLEVKSNKALMCLGHLKLKTFELPNRNTLTDKGISYLSNMPLVSLDLSHYLHITDEAMQYVGKIKSLRKLFLTGTKVTDRGLMLLTDLKDLSELSLVRCQVTDEGGILFRSLPRLSVLNLSTTNITDRLITRNHLNNCKYLKTLNLLRTYITSEGIELLRLPNLLFLNVDHTRVDPHSPPFIPGCPLLKQVLCKTRRPPPETS